MAGKGKISDIEAINIVGRAIFGDDWVGQSQQVVVDCLVTGKKRQKTKIVLVGLSDEDRKLIKKYGPHPGKRGGLTIEACPAEKRVERDRALSRQHRAEAQRGAAFDWLLDHRLHDQGSGCVREDIIAVLKSDPPRTAAAAAMRGAPVKYKAIGVLMRAQADSSERTEAEIKKASGKNLKKWYGADLKTCKKAIDFAFPNFS